jgi:hypothetical protein
VIDVLGGPGDPDADTPVFVRVGAVSVHVPSLDIADRLIAAFTAARAIREQQAASA